MPARRSDGEDDGGAGQPTGNALIQPDDYRPTLWLVDVVVRVADLAEVRPLQLAVLRPDGPLPGDRPPPPEALHVGAFRDGVAIGAATVLPERWPGPDPVHEPSWRLRAMVVAGADRRAGIGRAVLDHAVEVAAAHGARCVWAEARSAALGFYERAGWTVVGAEWMKAGIGPHRYIHLDLTPP